MSNATSTFGRRKESKYVTDFTTARRIVLGDTLSFVDSLRFDYIDDEPYFNLVESIYLDSPELSAFHEHLAGREDRFKVRLRHYSPDGIPEENVFLEIKSKCEGETVKRRIMLKPKWARAMMHGKGVSHRKIIRLNDKLDPDYVFEILRTLETLQNELHFSPMLKATYMRLAFRLRQSGAFRLTMDHNIQYQRLNFGVEPREAYGEGAGPDRVILEAKVADESHLPLLEALESVVGPARGFSKYCAGIYATRQFLPLEDRQAVLASLRRFRVLKPDSLDTESPLRKSS